MLRSSSSAPAAAGSPWGSAHSVRPSPSGRSTPPRAGRLALTTAAPGGMRARRVPKQATPAMLPAAPIAEVPPSGRTAGSRSDRMRARQRAAACSWPESAAPACSSGPVPWRGLRGSNELGRQTPPWMPDSGACSHSTPKLRPGSPSTPGYWPAENLGRQVGRCSRASFRCRSQARAVVASGGTIRDLHPVPYPLLPVIRRTDRCALGSRVQPNRRACRCHGRISVSVGCAANEPC